jgi:hypothetical protein
MSFYIESVYDTYSGNQNVTGTFSTYTYTRPLVVYTGDHFYHAYVEIIFHAPDNSDHYYNVTTTVMATPTDTIPVHYGYNQNETSDFVNFHYWGASNSPFMVLPYGGTASETIHSGYVFDGFTYYYSTRFSVGAVVQWSGGLFVHGGSYSITITIEETTPVGQNIVEMIIEQN